MKKKRDLRFQKTHRSIREAFKCLLLQKDFKAITVKEISQRANINRKTFYLHYHSIDELLMELEIEFAEQLLDMLRQEHSRMTFCQVRDICRAMNGIIKEDYELHMHLILSDNCQFFVEKVQELIIDEFLSELENRTEMSPADLKLIAFGIANGILSLYRKNYDQTLMI